MAAILSQPQCVNPKTPGNPLVRSQHCGYWCAGAKAPSHQYPQCWLNIHCIGPVSYKTISHKVNSIRKWNHILKKNYPVVYGLMWYCGLLILGHVGWGWLNQFTPFHYHPNSSVLSKHALAIKYQGNIWQVSPQLSYGDTCQIWTWFK